MIREKIENVIAMSALPIVRGGALPRDAATAILSLFLAEVEDCRTTDKDAVDYQFQRGYHAALDELKRRLSC